MFPDSSSQWVFYYFHMYFIQTLLITDQNPGAFQDTVTLSVSFLSGGLLSYNKHASCSPLLTNTRGFFPYKSKLLSSLKTAS